MKTFELTDGHDDFMMRIWETSRLMAIRFALEFIDKTSERELHVYEYDDDKVCSRLTIIKSAL